MTPQFRERYISRAEHNSIVAYYKKLVVQLHQARQTARDEHHIADSTSCASQDEKPIAHDCWGELGDVDFGGSGGNVIKLDFTRRLATDSLCSD